GRRGKGRGEEEGGTERGGGWGGSLAARPAKKTVENATPAAPKRTAALRSAPPSRRYGSAVAGSLNAAPGKPLIAKSVNSPTSAMPARMPVMPALCGLGFILHLRVRG